MEPAMIKWFVEYAPIRQKLAVAFGFFVVLLVGLSLFAYGALASFNEALASNDMATVRSASAGLLLLRTLCFAAAGLGLFAAIALRSGISGPYVATVLDMEALAAGQTDRPIVRATYKDCVGRLSKAMSTFRDTAVAQRVLAQQNQVLAHEQEQVVAALAEALKLLAEGNIAHSITEPFSDKYEELRQDFNSAKHALNTALSQVLTVAQGIDSGSTEISAAAEDLARRTEQQAATLQQTAVSLNSVTTGVSETALKAERATSAIKTAYADASDGGNVVREAVTAMSEIEKSSRAIAQIINVMDEIAFQTNLLALNAGVEAARAGESGRGFAVVATEVRALAQRATGAAKDIKALISESSRHVTSGVNLVNKTGETLVRIVDSVAAISTAVGEISSGAQAQSIDLQQVNTAITDMDQVTQQNAAMVEESTAASRSLTEEAQHLSSLVGRFQLLGNNTTSSMSMHPETHAAPAHRIRSVKAVRGNTALAHKTEPDWTSF
jgi:methyl-accepting chemotaxis protein